MENQHQKIKGYRDLSQEEIDRMNAIKNIGETLGEVIKSVSETPDIDQRWVAIAKTDLQKGIMALVRAIARPESF